MRHLALAGFAAMALFVGSVPALADGEYTLTCYAFASGGGDNSVAPTDYTSAGVVQWNDGTQNPPAVPKTPNHFATRHSVTQGSRAAMPSSSIRVVVIAALIRPIERPCWPWR